MAALARPVSVAAELDEFNRQLASVLERTPSAHRVIVAHVTDTHLLAPTETRAEVLADFPSANWARDRLGDVLTELRQLAIAPDVLLLGGDLTHSGAATEWSGLFAMLDPLGIPVVVTLGNHEHRNHLAADPAFQDSVNWLTSTSHGASDLAGRWAFEQALDGYRFVVLDSAHAGDLGAEQHDFLTTALARGDPTIVSVHRPVVRTDHWVDDLRLIDPRFESIVKNSDSMLAVVSGHAHRPRAVRHQNRLHLVSAAVNWGNQEPTGYRLLCLADGRLAWTVTRFVPGISCHEFNGPVVQQAGGASWEIADSSTR